MSQTLSDGKLHPALFLPVFQENYQIILGRNRALAAQSRLIVNNTLTHSKACKIPRKTPPTLKRIFQDRTFPLDVKARARANDSKNRRRKPGIHTHVSLEPFRPLSHSPR